MTIMIQNYRSTNTSSSSSTLPSLHERNRVLSPSSCSAPRQLLQMCLISLPIWQWIMNGMLLLFAAGGCRWCPSKLLRDFNLVMQKALLLLLAFCSSGTGTARDGGSLANSDPDRDHEHITSPLKPAMFKLKCRASPSRPLLWWMRGIQLFFVFFVCPVHYQQFHYCNRQISGSTFQNKSTLTALCFDKL